MQSQLRNALVEGIVGLCAAQKIDEKELVDIYVKIGPRRLIDLVDHLIDTERSFHDDIRRQIARAEHEAQCAKSHKRVIDYHHGLRVGGM